MENKILNTRAGRFFWKVTTYPKTLLTLGIGVILMAVAFIPQFTKDTRTEAFIPRDHPAVVYRDKVEEIFGLKDPMVIAATDAICFLGRCRRFGELFSQHDGLARLNPSLATRISKTKKQGLRNRGHAGNKFGI